MSQNTPLKHKRMTKHRARYKQRVEDARAKAVPRSQWKKPETWEDREEYANLMRELSTTNTEQQGD